LNSENLIIKRYILKKRFEMKKGTIVYLKLKPECVEKYKEYHDNIWPELVNAYHEAGITTVSCSINDSYLIVYEEYADGKYEEARKKLDSNKVEIRWQSLMRQLRDPSFELVKFKEIFRMEK
jgi:L-rhamnose mutarotase